MREGATLAELYDGAKGDDKGLVRKYFLNTICHGDVYLYPGVVDDTAIGLMRGLRTTDSIFFVELEWGILNTLSDTVSETMGRIDYRLPIQYGHKIHYRIVFKEKVSP